jgi:ABC-type transport system substrate-binding protein
MDENAYNPASAKKLLAEAGYPNGFKTNVVADTSRDKNGNLPDGT